MYILSIFDILHLKRRRKQVNYIDSYREGLVGEKTWVDIIEYIPELLPEILVGIDGFSRYREDVQ